jgi:hypothetical protein
MAISVERVAELEWASYAATVPIAQVTPGLDIVLRDDVVITTSEVLSSPDVNHACLLRATPQQVDGLIVEVMDLFQGRGISPTLFASPACVPPDLTEHLVRHGFVRLEEQEAWMALEHLQTFEIPPPSPHVVVRQAAKGEAMAVAQVFMASFGMPVEWAPYMAQLLEPSICLPSAHHYLALVDGAPVGTCSLICHGTLGVLGSAGVIPTRRGGRIATSLAAQAGQDARRAGVETLLLQTQADTWLERLLRISGFRRMFVRDCYVRP